MVFGRSRSSPSVQNQLHALEREKSASSERDLDVVEALGAGEESEALRRHFNVPPHTFAVILVGKDGTEKLRSDRPVAPAELFQIIDAMPMRQQEAAEHEAG